MRDDVIRHPSSVFGWRLAAGGCQLADHGSRITDHEESRMMHDG
jgi:hypothetical protein